MRGLVKSCCLVTLLSVASCAKGYEGIADLHLGQGAPSKTGGDPSSGGSGSAGSSAPMTTPPPAATGEECKQGDTKPCTCAATMTAGTLQCRADKRSSLGGYLATECTRCAAPKPVEPDPGDVTMSDAGTAGSSGSSAAGSGGSGGSGTTQPPPTMQMRGSCNPACTQTCFPVGILPCCRPAGGCGCTWAPGAYCL
jgi:hypothetical protein